MSIVLKTYKHLPLVLDRQTDRQMFQMSVNKVNEWEQDAEFSQMMARPTALSLCVIHPDLTLS